MGKVPDAEGFGLVIQARAVRVVSVPTDRYDSDGERLYKVVKEPLGSHRFLVYIDKYEEPVAVMLDNNGTPVPEKVLARGVGAFDVIGAALAVASKTAPACTGACRSGHPHEGAIRALLPE